MIEFFSFHFVLKQSGAKFKDVERQFLRFEIPGGRSIYVGAKPWLKMDARSRSDILSCMVKADFHLELVCKPFLPVLLYDVRTRVKRKFTSIQEIKCEVKYFALTWVIPLCRSCPLEVLVLF
jgi:hypothetical protein